MYEIQSATATLLSPGRTIEITEIEELVKQLWQVVIYSEDNSYRDYAGQGCPFTKIDAAKLEIGAYNPFIIIDGVGYKCKYKPCQALNQYANGLLNEV